MFDSMEAERNSFRHRGGFFDGERCRSVRAQPGLMDLIKAYRLALSSESAFQQAE